MDELKEKRLITRLIKRQELMGDRTRKSKLIIRIIKRQELTGDWTRKRGLHLPDDWYIPAARLAEKEGYFKKAIDLLIKAARPCDIQNAIEMAERNGLKEDIPSIWERSAEYVDNRGSKEICLERAAWTSRQLGNITEAEKYEKQFKDYTGMDIRYDDPISKLARGNIPEHFAKQEA